MNSTDNPVSKLRGENFLVTDIDNQAAGTGYAPWQNALGYNMTTTVVGSATRFTPQMHHRAPFNLHGAYFAGLSDQTTLQVTGIYYIERFPAIYETDLAVMAKNSAPSDAMALKIYTECMDKLPIAVKQGENPAGEWFDNVVNAVGWAARKVAPLLTMGSAINPAFGLAGSAASAIGNAASAYENLNRGGGGGKRKRKGKKQQKQGSAPPPVPSRNTVEYRSAVQRMRAGNSQNRKRGRKGKGQARGQVAPGRTYSG